MSKYPPDVQAMIGQLFNDIIAAENTVYLLRDRASALIAEQGVSIKRTESRLRRAGEYLYEARYYAEYDGIRERQVQTRAMREASVEHELT